MRILFLCVLMLAGLLPLASNAPAKQNTLKEELIYRVTLGSPKDVALLLHHTGGTPNQTDSLGYPLLYLAALRTDPLALDVVKKLVELGADVNYHGGRKHYPIMAAMQSDNAEMVEFLMEQGADYRATDAYGISIVEFARASGNQQIADMIEYALSETLRQLAGSRTQQRLDELTYQLAYHACAQQYWAYYYQSGQDKIPQKQQDAVLSQHRDKVHEAMSALASTFKLEQDEISGVYHGTRKPMFRELEEMVSNRWRRKQGIGSEEDMVKRCTPYAEPYREDVFDKAELDERR